MTWLISGGMHESFIITKLATRKDLIAKNKHFSPKSGDENGARRQKIAVFTKKW
ncbi:hypothetical protein [Caldibacillus thermoamylovorans]|uniref:hypothetical protein n=1 Tax=Caldibacillus thermoamylovorans TaxID=35841 RepID=UPI0013751C17|nr:hypothetical protein [Caldibacillus thermoamylovorans]